MTTWRRQHLHRLKGLSLEELERRVLLTGYPLISSGSSVSDVNFDGVYDEFVINQYLYDSQGEILSRKTLVDENQDGSVDYVSFQETFDKGISRNQITREDANSDGVIDAVLEVTYSPTGRVLLSKNRTDWDRDGVFDVDVESTYNIRGQVINYRERFDTDGLPGLDAERQRRWAYGSAPEFLQTRVFDGYDYDLDGRLDIITTHEIYRETGLQSNPLEEVLFLSQSDEDSNGVPEKITRRETFDDGSRLTFSQIQRDFNLDGVDDWFREESHFDAEGTLVFQEERYDLDADGTIDHVSERFRLSETGQVVESLWQQDKDFDGYFEDFRLTEQPEGENYKLVLIARDVNSDGVKDFATRHETTFDDDGRKLSETSRSSSSLGSNVATTTYKYFPSGALESIRSEFDHDGDGVTDFVSQDETYRDGDLVDEPQVRTRIFRQDNDGDGVPEFTSDTTAEYNEVGVLISTIERTSYEWVKGKPGSTVKTSQYDEEGREKIRVIENDTDNDGVMDNSTREEFRHVEESTWPVFKGLDYDGDGNFDVVETDLRYDELGRLTFSANRADYLRDGILDDVWLRTDKYEGETRTELRVRYRGPEDGNPVSVQETVFDGEDRVLRSAQSWDNDADGIPESSTFEETEYDALGQLLGSRRTRTENGVERVDSSLTQSVDLVTGETVFTTINFYRGEQSLVRESRVDSSNRLVSEESQFVIASGDPTYSWSTYAYDEDGNLSESYTVETRGLNGEQLANATLVKYWPNGATESILQGIDVEVDGVIDVVHSERTYNDARLPLLEMGGVDINNDGTFDRFRSTNYRYHDNGAEQLVTTTVSDRLGQEEYIEQEVESDELGREIRTLVQQDVNEDLIPESNESSYFDYDGQGNKRRVQTRSLGKLNGEVVLRVVEYSANGHVVVSNTLDVGNDGEVDIVEFALEELGNGLQRITQQSGHEVDGIVDTTTVVTRDAFGNFVVESVDSDTDRNGSTDRFDSGTYVVDQIGRLLPENESKSNDLNGDGIIDRTSLVWREYTADATLVSIRFEEDYDGDGTVDFVPREEYYDDEGRLIEHIARLDLDEDGVPSSVATETFTYTWHAEPIKHTLFKDNDADGSIDESRVIHHFREVFFSDLNVTEFDSNGDGIIDRRTGYDGPTIATGEALPLVEQMSLRANEFGVSIPQAESAKSSLLAGQNSQAAASLRSAIEAVEADATLSDVQKLELTHAADQAILFVRPGFGAAGNGDFDGDGTIGFSDFLVLSANFGRSDSAVTQLVGDVDRDGTVSFADFLILSANFGTRA